MLRAGWIDPERERSQESKGWMGGGEIGAALGADMMDARVERDGGAVRKKEQKAN